MNSAYCDRIYQFERNFENDPEKYRILVVGNSFARDWGNILLESEFADRVDLSYAYSFDDKAVSRVADSDYLFVFMDKEDVPERVWELIDSDRVYGIGTKNFGESNGIIYSQRFKPDYYQTKIRLSQPYIDLNRAWKEHWGKNYLDLISYVVDDDNMVRVFSDEHLLMSQDCHHLTRGGARYYASRIDLSIILDENVLKENRNG